MLRFLIFTILALLLITQNCHANDEHFDEQLLKEYSQDCLKEANFTVTDMGVESLDLLIESGLSPIHSVRQDLRAYFMACWFKKVGLIGENNKIIKSMVPENPNPDKRYPVSYEASIAACDDKENYFDLGDCLYDVFY